MPRGKTEYAENIIPKLREVEVEVEVGRGKTVVEAVKKIGVTEQTYYRWKKKFGGLRMDQTKRRRAVEHVRRVFGQCSVSERRAYRVIDVAKNLTSENVLEWLSDLFIRRGIPEHIRSDNGSEFTAKCVREWLGRVGVKTLYVEPGSPGENGDVESYNGKLRDERLKRESFDTILEAKVLVDRWRQDYNTIRPHSALGYRPPAPETRQPCAVASATAQG